MELTKKQKKMENKGLEEEEEKMIDLVEMFIMIIRLKLKKQPNRKKKERMN